jgi:acetyl esterase/lipase
MEEEPPVDEVSPQLSRRIREEGTPRTGRLVFSPSAVERSIPGPRGEIPLRIFFPSEIRGAYLHFHGGGWVLGSARHQDSYLEALAKKIGCVVISVEYALAPEHPYPAAPDDCEAAAQWLIENSRREFGTQRLLVGGESAGAQLAVGTLLRLKNSRAAVCGAGAAGAGGEAGTGFAGANLSYGVYDLTGTPSMRNWGKRRLVLNTPVMFWFAEQFVPSSLRGDPDVSPLFASSEALAGLPPALFTVGTFDLLLDDSLFMASRWTAAGSHAELAVYPGGVHGFVLLNYSLGKKARERAEEFLEACLAGGV